MNIDFRATSKLDARYVRYLGDIKSSSFLSYMGNIGKILESSFFYIFQYSCR